MKTEVLTWAGREMDRQLAGLKTCHECGAVATVGYWTTCGHCGKPICDSCAVQFNDGVFCKQCPQELPF